MLSAKSNQAGKRKVQASTPAGVPTDRRPGRIEFMSTQRRAYRLQCMSCTNRAEEREANRDGSLSPATMRVLPSPAPFARVIHASVSGGTASPKRLVTQWAKVATNSLQKENRSVRFVRHGQPLHRSTAYRSSLSPNSILSGFARVHPTLPQDPAANGCRAERHDGKGNLHFKHAA